ncbi:gamma-tubulin complex component 5 [Stomoxys calcitrans]|uniref:gamma-tubulin complex component 5 n=1 Tax=Stomoxys calcitrans TaxID=35570 RepID=UPI0027E3749A|nr:gamma-tubulin complex component 5 [Stomoxys calcitrans]
MSALDQRNDIIIECVPDLVRQLTGFDEDDINTEHCIHFAWNIIRNHRNLSTNSHDVRRKIEGIQERFCVDNSPEYAEYLGRLCDEVVKHPLCVDHYEVDVHWSLLDFLFALAYNPTGALKKNKHKIEIAPVVNENVGVKDAEKAYWLNVLREDFIAIPKYEDNESDLSDWTDNEDDDESSENATVNCTNNVEDRSIDEGKCIVSVHPSVLSALKPPQKSVPYTLFDTSKPEKRLCETIQHSWWNTDKDIHLNAVVESDHIMANFSLDYSRYLSDTSNNLIRFEEPKTIAEQHLLREILWMFQRPTNCAVFQLEGEQLKIRPNVTIPSCGVNALQSYLEDQYMPYIKMMNVLRQFHRAIYSYEDSLPPRTLECYAANIHLHLSPVWHSILEFERRLINPKDFEINTLITMRSYLDEALRQLESLYEIHEKVFLDWRQHPAHITSAFLLASLMNSYQKESNVAKGNLFMSLLLASIKVFCEIIDTWWTDGRLDDWQQEYIVERANNNDQSVCMREYHKNKSRAFFVPTHVSQVIEENSLFQLMREHSLEAGRTLNLLYEINRIGDLRKDCAAMGGKLYNVFIGDFLKQVDILQNEVAQVSGGDSDNSVVEVEPNDSGFFNDIAVKAGSEKNNSNSILNCLTTNDSHLLMAFAMNTSEEDLSITDQEKETISQKTTDATTIYESLQKRDCSKNLPLEELLITSLTHIFRMRIAFANSFVLKLYREEFMILKHLRNIRKVMLLEASDVMHIFYTKLFAQIESGESWANRSLLTMHLDDIICSKFPDMSMLFCVEVNSAYRCQTTKVVEAVEELVLSYNFSRELAHIISTEDIEAYNKVFCFLLKVKWGITTLENLRFARSHKRRIPYAQFEMIDLIMRRLEQLRFWMMYAIQSVHFHLMTHVLQSMGEQLDEKIENCENLKEMEMVHKSYLSTVCEHCFLVDSVNTIKLGVEQLLSLVSILRAEWLSCVKYIETNNPLAISLDDSSVDDEDMDNDFVTNSQIDAMEYTYICCHQYLANILNDQVYLKKNTFLSGLRAAFNTSLPH